MAIDQLQRVARVEERFDALYPERNQGNAWMSRVGERVFITNSRENSDEVQTYEIPFDTPAAIGALGGVVLPHSYVMARIDGSGAGLWLQANVDQKGDYPDDRQSALWIEAVSEPDLVVTPEAALVQADWNPSEGRLSIQLIHDEGAVDVRVDVP